METEATKLHNVDSNLTDTLTALRQGNDVLEEHHRRTQTLAELTRRLDARAATLELHTRSLQHAALAGLAAGALSAVLWVVGRVLG